LINNLSQISVISPQSVCRDKLLVGDTLVKVGHNATDDFTSEELNLILSRELSTISTLVFSRLDMTNGKERTFITINFSHPSDESDKAELNEAVEESEARTLVQDIFEYQAEPEARPAHIVGDLMALGFCRRDVESCLRRAGGRANLAASLLYDEEEARCARRERAVAEAAGRRGWMGLMRAWGRGLWQRLTSGSLDC